MSIPILGNHIFNYKYPLFRFLGKDLNELFGGSKFGVGKKVDNWHILGYNIAIWHHGGSYDTEDTGFRIVPGEVQQPV